MDYNDYTFVHVNLKDWLYLFFSLISINFIELQLSCFLLLPTFVFLRAINE